MSLFCWKGKDMEFKEGYFYFVKDEYYEKVQDKELMKNKENGITLMALIISVIILVILAGVNI